MSYITLPIRTSNDMNSAADINQLMENIEYVKAQTENNNNIITNNIELQNATYSPYYVVNELRNPSVAVHGELNYRTSDNKLFKYNAITSTWVEIDWVNAIKATPEWIAGKLRISSGMLQITPNSGTNWYDCYPLAGAQKYAIKTIDDTNYTYKYFITHGEAIILNCNHIPIVFAREVPSEYELTSVWGQEAGTNLWYGFRINDTSASNLVYTIRNGGSSLTQDASTSTNMITIAYSNISSNQYCVSNVRVDTNYIVCTTHSNYAGSFNVLLNSYSTCASTFYWFGVYYTHTPTKLSNVSYIRIKKRS